MIPKARYAGARLPQDALKLLHEPDSRVARKVDLQEGRAGRNFEPDPAIPLCRNRRVTDVKRVILHGPTSFVLVEGRPYRAGVTERVLPLTFSGLGQRLDIVGFLPRQALRKDALKRHSGMTGEGNFASRASRLVAQNECLPVFGDDFKRLSDVRNTHVLSPNRFLAVPRNEQWGEVVHVERDVEHGCKIKLCKVDARLLGFLQDDGLSVHLARHASKLGSVDPKLSRLSDFLLPHGAGMRAGQINHIHRQSPKSAASIARGEGAVMPEPSWNRGRT